jgi:hypothetical protein
MKRLFFLIFKYFLAAVNCGYRISGYGGTTVRNISRVAGKDVVVSWIVGSGYKKCFNEDTNVNKRAGECSSEHKIELKYTGLLFCIL